MRIIQLCATVCAKSLISCFFLCGGSSDGGGSAALPFHSNPFSVCCSKRSNTQLFPRNTPTHQPRHTINSVHLWTSRVCIQRTHPLQWVRISADPFHVHLPLRPPRRQHSSELFNVINLIPQSQTGRLFNGTLSAWTRWPVVPSSTDQIHYLCPC